MRKLVKPTTKQKNVDDCNCGKPLKVNDPRRKLINKKKK